jgi:hypothetical protein
MRRFGYRAGDHACGRACDHSSTLAARPAFFIPADPAKEHA